MTIGSYSIAIGVGVTIDIAVHDVLDSLSDTIDSILDSVHDGLGSVGGGGSIYGILDTIDKGTGGIRGGGSDRLIKQERFKDCKSILEVVCDDIDQVATIHEIVDDRPGR